MSGQPDLGRLQPPEPPAEDDNRVFGVGQLVQVDLGGVPLVGRVLRAHGPDSINSEWSGVDVILSSGRVLRLPGSFVRYGLVAALPRGGGR